jgi:hypothetical protein
LRIKLKYPDVEAFLHRYGPNITKTSVFIGTKSVKPVGTTVRFEFVLVNPSGEQPVFRGEGTVEMVREADAVAPGKPQGMSVKFERLFGDGAELVERAIKLRPRGQRGTIPPPPPPPVPTQRETSSEELTSPRDISSGEFAGLAAAPTPAPPPPELEPPEVPSPPVAATQEALAPPEAPDAPPPAEPAPRETPAAPPADDPRAARAPVAHVDVDALAAEWQISTDRVDEILRRRRPRDPAYAAELEALLSAPTQASVSPAEATARLAQLLDRRRRPR